MATRRRFQDLVRRLPETTAAIAYAEQQHAGQRNTADGAPFILHPLEVGTLLYDAGASDDVIAAGVLHDTIEKTDAKAGDLSARFGSHIATLVLAVSEDEGISGYAARKAALRRQVAGGGTEALMVFAADKVSKARELRRLGPPSGPRLAEQKRTRSRRLAHYRSCLDLLEESLAGSPLVAQLRRELGGNARPPRKRQALASVS